MIVFTVPTQTMEGTVIGERKYFVSPRKIKEFEITNDFDEGIYVKVHVGHRNCHWIPYSSMEKAEKYVREAIDAIMDDIDYEFPMYEVK